MAAPGASSATTAAAATSSGSADWLGDGGRCCDGGDPCRDYLECRRFEVAGVGVEIRQDVRGSHALRPLDDDRPAPRDGDEPPPPLILTGACVPVCVGGGDMAERVSGCEALVRPPPLLPHRLVCIGWGQ